MPVPNECGGTDRWSVKIVTDGVTLNSEILSKTVEQLREEPIPGPIEISTPRYPFEQNIITTKGELVYYKGETDMDIHAVLSNGKGTIIIEFPDVTCPDMKNSPILQEATTAKANFLEIVKGHSKEKFFKTGISVNVTGVAFFDLTHGTPQIGVAPNGIELHPVLSITPTK